ncbi:Ferredoxin subunit of nitrite reductase or a ring-hydroxylating dioxygenase [Sphingobium faniae]|nr:Ferredoxin subunit of nitrite reductase or a ring-hydroxylating dioxygenase [Sphingobium faniae]
MPTISIATPDLADGGSTIVEADGQRLFLCRSGGVLRAASEMCPHQKLSLAGARIRKGSLFCPHHGARFDMDTGKSLSTLTSKPVVWLPLREAGETIEIDL